MADFIDSGKEIYWWGIKKSHDFMQNIINEIRENRSVIISLPCDTPFKDEFINSLKERVQGTRTFEKLEYPKDKLGEFLLTSKEYVSEDIECEYRSGKSYGEFLSKRETELGDKILYFDNIEESQYDDLSEFLSDYEKVNNDTKGIFIFEINCNCDSLEKRSKEVQIIPFHPIKGFDVYSYCVLLASQVKVDNHFRNYLAELAYNICGDKVELCLECINKGDKFISNPVETFKEIVKENEKYDYHDITNRDRVEKAIRKAQVREFYPITQNYREYFIDKYREEIRKLLPYIHKRDRNEISINKNEPSIDCNAWCTESIENVDLGIAYSMSYKILDYESNKKEIKGFIIEYENEIKKLLPFKNNYTGSTIKSFKTIHDIYYVYREKKIEIKDNDDKNLANIKKYQDISIIFFVKTIRNSLSHFGIISKEQMKFLYEVNKEINEKSN